MLNYILYKTIQDGHKALLYMHIEIITSALDFLLGPYPKYICETGSAALCDMVRVFSIGWVKRFYQIENLYAMVQFSFSFCIVCLLVCFVSTVDMQGTTDQ